MVTLSIISIKLCYTLFYYIFFQNQRQLSTQTWLLFVDNYKVVSSKLQIVQNYYKTLFSKFKIVKGA